MRTVVGFLFIAIFFLSGCTSLYFANVVPESSEQKSALSDFAFSEYWTGIVFNGNKIGFSHLKISSGDQKKGLFDIYSEAFLALHFLMLDKNFSMRSKDTIAADLTLRGFEYDYEIDQSRIMQQGRVESGRLLVEVISNDETTMLEFPFEGPIYSTGVIALYPVVHGMAIGKSYKYQVYDGETRTIASVDQEVVAYEKSELFAGTAYKVITKLHGQKVTSWIDALGRPVLEMSLGGVIIAGLEDEARAKRYLVSGALNKSDILLDFSLITPEKKISNPRDVTSLDVVLLGIDRLADLSGNGQACREKDHKISCKVTRMQGDDEREKTALDSDVHTRATVIISSSSSEIISTAQSIAGDTQDPLVRIRKIIQWLQENIDKRAVDVFSALDVLRKKQAECQGHAYLYAAFARSLGIPTRIVNGIVYSENYNGFLFHTWAESYIDGSWLSIDPTFAQIGVDATHIRMLEGEGLADLLPLVELIGRIKVEVVEYH